MIDFTYLASEKKMKYCSIVFVCLFLFFSFALSQSITLTTSTDTIDINGTLSLVANIQGVTQVGEITIQGLDAFVLLGQGQSTSMQIINGQQTMSMQLQVQLQPMSSGSFVLGPAQLAYGTGMLSSNTITVTVTGEKIFLQPQVASAIASAEEQQVSDDIISQASGLEIHPASRPWWWRVVGGGLFVLGWILRAKKVVYVYKQTCVREATEHPDPSKALDMPMPDVDQEDFWEQMDVWWRHQVSALIHRSCVTATYQELRVLIHSLPKPYQDTFLAAFEILQGVRYAGGLHTPQEMIALAHKLLIIQ